MCFKGKQYKWFPFFNQCYHFAKVKHKLFVFILYFFNFQIEESELVVSVVQTSRHRCILQLLPVKCTPIITSLCPLGFLQTWITMTTQRIMGKNKQTVLLTAQNCSSIVNLQLWWALKTSRSQTSPLNVFQYFKDMMTVLFYLDYHFMMMLHKLYVLFLMQMWTNNMKLFILTNTAVLNLLKPFPCL